MSLNLHKLPPNPTNVERGSAIRQQQDTNQMYDAIADIDSEIAELHEQRDCLILYWFEMGEADRNYGLKPQYPDNTWYMSGYWDRDYQLEIGIHNPQL